MSKKSSFCPLPFIHLATHPIGTISPCCSSEMNGGMSTAKKDGKNMHLGEFSIAETYNSEMFKKIRLQMLNGERPLECQTCYKKEDQGIKSKRQLSLETSTLTLEHAHTLINQSGEVNEIKLTSLELRLENVCNLKCVTCNPFSSSKWNEDVDIFKNTEFEDRYFLLKDRLWSSKGSFYSELLDYSSNINEININGGEPTLIKEHFVYLKKLVDLKLSDKINLNYFINLSYIPESMIELWMHFKSIRVQVSIDDYGKRNDYLRFGSIFSEVEKNLKTLLKKNIRTGITQTISALNVTNINALKKYSLSLGIDIEHNYVYAPSFMHVSNLPPDWKRKTLENARFLNVDELELLRAELYTSKIRTNAQELIHFIALLDKKRNIKIEEYLHEWKNLKNELKY